MATDPKILYSPLFVEHAGSRDTIPWKCPPFVVLHSRFLTPLPQPHSLNTGHVWHVQVVRSAVFFGRNPLAASIVRESSPRKMISWVLAVLSVIKNARA